MTYPITPVFFHDIINQLPLGVFFLSQDGIIQEWNDWMMEKTHIKAEDAIGNKLPDLFIRFNHPRFAWALDMVFSTSSPQLLSQVLNKYVVTIPIILVNNFGVDNMQQKVQIAALTLDNGQTLAMVTVVDVTENALQENALLAAATLLQENSYRDALTNLYNRRFLDIWLKKELLTAKRYAYPVSCLMLDLDNFKKINDKLGHVIGDKVLCDFSNILLKQIRESDVCARYGGEEFMIVLTHSTLENALVRANSLNNMVRKSAIGGQAPGVITCSIGVSVFSSERPKTQDALIKQADKQLYKAKRSGRDCVY